MKEWICIYCGTTMSSKCPGQRSEFFGGDIAMIRNALATHVLDVAQDKKEVFLNLTFWGKNTENVDPVIATIEQLAEWKEKLIAVSCDHHFVINSMERTECQLGHEHYNLTDKEKLLADRPSPEEFKVTFEDVKQTYIDFLGTQMDLAKTNMKTLCPDIRSSDPEYDRFRRWYFVFQDEMDQIKYDMQKGLQRLKEGQPYRKKYQVYFGYDSDIPNMHTDDILQAEAVYKYYTRAGIKCSINILTHDKADSTSINYRPLEKDPDLRLRCCECKQFINPGEKLIMADPIQEDEYGREKHVRSLGEVMHASCNKKITDLDKIFHRCVTVHITDEERRHFSQCWCSAWDMDQLLKARWNGFRYMEVTDIWEHGNKRGIINNAYRVRIKGLGRQFDELKHHLKPVTKKETK